jgi:hypothetical protein
MAVNRSIRAAHLGADLPDELTSMGNIQSVPALLERTSKAMLADNAAALAKAGPAVQSLIDEDKKRDHQRF